MASWASVLQSAFLQDSTPKRELSLASNDFVLQMRKRGTSAPAEIPRFACWWLSPPNPYFADWHLRLRIVPAFFLKHNIRRQPPVSLKSRWRTAKVSPANAVSHPYPQCKFGQRCRRKKRSPVFTRLNTALLSTAKSLHPLLSLLALLYKS